MGTHLLLDVVSLLVGTVGLYAFYHFAWLFVHHLVYLFLHRLRQILHSLLHLLTESLVCCLDCILCAGLFQSLLPLYFCDAGLLLIVATNLLHLLPHIFHRLFGQSVGLFLLQPITLGSGLDDARLDGLGNTGFNLVYSLHHTCC